MKEASKDGGLGTLLWLFDQSNLMGWIETSGKKLAGRGRQLGSSEAGCEGWQGQPWQLLCLSGGGLSLEFSGSPTPCPPSWRRSMLAASSAPCEVFSVYSRQKHGCCRGWLCMPSQQHPQSTNAMGTYTGVDSWAGEPS